VTGRRAANSPPPCSTARGPSREVAVTCGFGVPLVTAGARWDPLGADAVRTQCGPTTSSLPRPVRIERLQPGCDRHQLGRRVRLARSDHCLVGKRPQGRAAPCPRPLLLNRHREAVAAQLGPIGTDRPEHRVEANAGHERCAAVHLEVGRARSTRRGGQVAQRQPACGHRADPVRVEVDRAGHGEGDVWRCTMDVDLDLDSEGALVLGRGGDQDLAGSLPGDRSQGAVEAGVRLSGAGGDDRGEGGDDREES